MKSILHISDLHFGPPYVSRVGEALLRIAPTIAPDVIVASGDFTQRAKREQFINAQAFLQDLPDVPKIVVPGNHDVPLYRIKERLTAPLGLYKEYISAELNHVVQFEDLIFVALDSTSPKRTISNGRIHREQLDYCSNVLSSAPANAAKIVVAHHHFAPAPDYARDKIMPKAQRAINRFVELGVDMILGGHLHRAYIGNTLDFYPGSHRERGIIIVQCGTTTSRRGRGKEKEKNTFNVIRINDQQIHITHYMFFDDAHGFAPISQHVFPRPGQRLALA